MYAILLPPSIEELNWRELKISFWAVFKDIFKIQPNIQEGAFRENSYAIQPLTISVKSFILDV